MPRKAASSPVFEAPYAPETLPVMQDEPFDNPTAEEPPRKRHEDEPDDPNHPVPDPGEEPDDPGNDEERERPGKHQPREPDEIHPPAGEVRYESRIQILDAFQYPGSLVHAPPWVDRNWIGFGDYDQLRGIEPGPCLRVPLPSGVTALCRVGDYVCRQSVTLVQGNPAEIRLEVWDREQFVKLFVPAVQPVASEQATGGQVRSTQQRTPSKPAFSEHVA